MWMEQLVHARASINLPGLPLGRVVIVDLSEPYVAEAIKHGFLVPEQAVTGGTASEPELSAG